MLSSAVYKCSACGVVCRSTNNTSPRPWLHAAVNGDSGRGKAVGGSFSARSHTSTDDVQPTAAAGSPTRVSLDQQRQQQQGYAAVSLASVQPLQIHDEDAATADAEELDQWQMPLQHADKAVNQQVCVGSSTPCELILLIAFAALQNVYEHTRL